MHREIYECLECMHMMDMQCQTDESFKVDGSQLKNVIESGCKKNQLFEAKLSFKAS